MKTKNLTFSIALLLLVGGCSNQLPEEGNERDSNQVETIECGPLDFDELASILDLHSTRNGMWHFHTRLFGFSLRCNEDTVKGDYLVLEKEEMGIQNRKRKPGQHIPYYGNTSVELKFEEKEIAQAIFGHSDQENIFDEYQKIRAVLASNSVMAFNNNIAGSRSTITTFDSIAYYYGRVENLGDSIDQERQYTSDSTYWFRQIR